MAIGYGLFDKQREFLLGVHYDIRGHGDFDYAWVRVRLVEGWDIAGSGVQALRSAFGAQFTDQFVPEFTMVSLDGAMLLNTTVRGNGTVSTIVIALTASIPGPDRTDEVGTRIRPLPAGQSPATSSTSRDAPHDATASRRPGKPSETSFPGQRLLEATWR